MPLSPVCWWLEQLSLIAALIEITCIKYSNILQSGAWREAPQTPGSKVTLFLCHRQCKHGKKLPGWQRHTNCRTALSNSFQAVLHTAQHGHCPNSWTLPLACSEEHSSVQTNLSSSGFVSNAPSGLIFCTSTKWLRVAARMSVEGNFEMCCL